MSEGRDRPMSKNELAAFSARMDAEKYGKKTDLIKSIVGKIARIIIWGITIYGLIEISKSRPGSIKALCELVKAFREGNGIGTWYVIALLTMTVAAFAFSVLLFIVQRQKSRAIQQLGVIQRRYETLLNAANQSSGINSDGSTPGR